MQTFYLQFLPHLPTILQPLHQVLKKGHVFRWSYDKERVFNEAKGLLRKIPVLIDEVHKPLLLTCDASSYGVGAVLAHQTEDGEHPIGFHFMAPTERNYSQVKKEALSMFCGVPKFHKYLWGRHFKIYMDHKLLLSLLGELKPLPQYSSARLKRWDLLILWARV